MSRLPSIRPRKVVAALRQIGFLEHHQKGSHLYMRHPQTLRLTSVPIHPTDVKPVRFELSLNKRVSPKRSFASSSEIVSHCLTASAPLAPAPAMLCPAARR